MRKQEIEQKNAISLYVVQPIQQNSMDINEILLRIDGLRVDNWVSNIL